MPKRRRQRAAQRTRPGPFASADETRRLARYYLVSDKLPANPVRTAYHHGALRRALLDAALALVAEGGLERLSLREAARRAGVSHAAPYHHYPTKAALVSDLAEESWALLAERVRAAAAAPTATRIEALVTSYVGFARDEPARFELIREHEPAGGSGQPTAALVLFPILTAAMSDLQAAGFAPKGDPAPLVLTTWAAMHGLATLVVGGPLGSQTQPEMIGQLAAVVARELRAGWSALAAS